MKLHRWTKTIGEAIVLTNESGGIFPKQISRQLIRQLAGAIFTRDYGQGILTGIILRLYLTK